MKTKYAISEAKRQTEEYIEYLIKGMVVTKEDEVYIAVIKEAFKSGFYSGVTLQEEDD